MSLIPSSPIIWLGADDEGCSGGNQADGSNCFSMRLMWREGGRFIIIYALHYALFVHFHCCADAL